MRIGIDARELCGRPTGVGRYLRGLLNAWASDAAIAHEFVLYAHAPLTLPFDQRVRASLVPGTGGTWWEQVSLAAATARDRLDVLFSPAYSTPLRSHVPRVVALHDLSFVAHPLWFTTREGMRRRWLARQSAAAARAAITISQFSRGEIAERLGVPWSRIHVIPPGVTPPVLPPLLARPASDEAALLYVGSIFNRRHLPDLIRAFAPLARSHAGAKLDIVGDNRTYPREDLAATIASEGLADRVVWRPYVSDQVLGELFAAARAFAFLSEYEGLGLTPLEALAVGVPPVLLDTAVARESCGEAALYVPLGDRPATTAALETALFDAAGRGRLLAAAPATLGRYDWDTAARETLAVLEHAAR